MQTPAQDSVEVRPARAQLFISVALVLGVVLLFARTFAFEFVNYDDDQYVFENPAVLGGLTADSVKWAFTAFHSANWHPLTWLSHMLDVELFGLDAGAHHRTNVLLHALNAVLVFTLLRRITKQLWPAAIVAALFAVHPVRVESVAWVAERKDLLAACFGLAALHAWVGYAERGGARRYLVALLLVAAGLMAKPMLVTWPFVLLLLDGGPLKRLRNADGRSQVGRVLVEKLPFLALAGASVVITIRAQATTTAITWFAQLPLGQRLANALHAYASYASTHFAPGGLGVIYPHGATIPGTPPLTMGGLEFLLAAALIASVFGAWRIASRSPWLSFGWLFFLGTLVPVIGLFQVGIQSHADRYAYLPLLGLHIAVVFGLGAFVRSESVRPNLGRGFVIALVALGFLTWRQVDTWRDSIVLFERAIAVTENNFIAEYNLATAYMARQEYAEAEEHFRASLAIRSDQPNAWNGVGLSLVHRGRLLEAEQPFRDALRVNQNDVDALVNLAGVLRGKREEEGAMWMLERAVKIDPAHPEALRNLGISLYRAGRHAEAKRCLQESFARATPDANFADLLAWILATSSDAGVRDGVEARRWIRHAIDLAGEGNPKHLDTLAAVHAERGEFQDAVFVQEMALGSMPSGLQAAGERRLELYRSRRAYRSGSGNER